MRRIVLCASLILGFTLALSSVALARHGLGLIGPRGSDDKVVTNAGFLLIAFFPAFVAFMSFVQWKLDKRKNAHKQALRARASRREWRAGW